MFRFIQNKNHKLDADPFLQFDYRTVSNVPKFVILASHSLCSVDLDRGRDWTRRFYDA